MMIFLALLLAFIAFRSMRARNGRGSAGMLLVGALAAGSLASGLGGFNLLRDAVAGGSMTTPIEDANGQTFELKYGRNDFQNESGVIQRVARIMLTDEGERDCTNAAGLAEPQVALIQECREDLQLDEGESCRIECED
jgi:hypothetical protein